MMANEILNIFAFKKHYIENNSFFRALFMGTMSSFIYQGLNFVTIIFITRHLGEDRMGQFALIQSAVIMLLTFGILGMNVSATALIAKFKRRYPNQIGLLVGNSYMITITMTSIVVLVSIALSEIIFSNALLSSQNSGFLKLAIIIWFVGMTFDMVQVSTLLGLEAFRDLIKTDIVKGSFSIVVILPLAVKYGLTGVVVGYAFSSFIGIGINQWFIRKNLKVLNSRIVFRISPLLVRRLMKIGLPVFIAALFISPTTWFTNKLVFNEEGGAYILGIVFVCRQLLVLLQFLPTQISKVTLPLISNRVGTPDERKFKGLSLILSLSASLLLLTTGLLFERSVLNIYSLDPDVASLPYRIILLTMVFSTINIMIGQFAIIGKNPWIRAYSDIIISVVMVCASIIMIRVNLLLALPVSMLSSYVISNIFLVYSTRKDIPGFIK